MKKKYNLGGDAPCADCRTKDNPVWFTDNVFWNEVMRNVKGSGILCTYCFIIRAEKKFRVTGWRLLPEWKWREK